MSQEEVAKLDRLIDIVTEMRIDLAKHIAEDTAAWIQVAKNEEQIKTLVAETGKLRTRHAALAATIGAAIASGAQALLRFV